MIKKIVSSILTLVLGAVTSLTAIADDFVISFVDGTKSLGQIRELRANEISIFSDDSETKIDVRKIAFIKSNRSPSARNPDGMIIQLVGGTLLPVKQLRMVDQQFTANVSEDEFTIDTKDLDWVLMRPFATENDRTAWNKVDSDRPERGDTLVIKRDQAIDWLEGIVKSIGKERIEFKYNDRDVSIKLERIEGFFLYHASGREFSDPVCRVKISNGGLILVKTFTVTDTSVTFSTVCGAEITIAKGDIVEFDFASGRVQFLTEMSPSFSDWQPLVASAAEIEFLKRMNNPRFNRSFGNQSLSLNVQEELNPESWVVRNFDKGIAIKGGSKLVYQLSGKYKSLQGLVGFPPEGNANGSVQLKVRGDGKILWEQVLKNDRRHVVPLKINIQNVQRLAIETDYFDGRAVGDTLHLCEIRVSK